MNKLAVTIFLFISINLIGGINYVEVANNEIKVTDRSKNESYKGAATIDIKFKDFVKPPQDSNLLVGLLFSHYNLYGTYDNNIFYRFDYGRTEKKIMPRIKISYLPFSIKTLRLGFFGQISYTNHLIDLKTITNIDAFNTKLHSLFSGFGLIFEKSFISKNFFLGSNIGILKLKFIQSSDMSSARFTKSKNAFTISPYIRYNLISKVSLYLSYEYLKFHRTNINPKIHYMYIGILGEL